MTTIHIPSEQGAVIVATQSIIRIEALNNYSRIIFLDRKPLVVAKVLHWFQDRLPETFWRIHKSHLVNCSHIEKVDGTWAGSSVLLSSGEAINVSRRKRWLLSRSDLPLQAQRAA